MKEPTYDRGNISESILLHAYLKAGFIVSTPFGSGAPYDLMLDTEEHTSRIQVKTGWYRRLHQFSRHTPSERSDADSKAS